MKKDLSVALGIFTCSNEEDEWFGEIKYIESYGSHYEMGINARSSIKVIFGKTRAGNFLSVPEFEKGSELSYLKDRFWNTEALTRVLGEVDGITVAEALCHVSNYI